jgi:hypothetical protein
VVKNTGVSNLITEVRTLKKSELIERLQDFVDNPSNNNSPAARMNLAFTGYFIHFLKKLDTRAHDKWDFSNILPYLPNILVGAFQHLRTGTDKTTQRFRQIYESAGEEKVPDIVNLGVSGLVRQGLTVQSLCHLMEDITGNEWINPQIERYCNAQLHVLQQTFDKFLWSVYQNGLHKVIKKCKQRGMSGRFGKTELRTFITAGRIMFTFTRKIDDTKETSDSNEWSVSFVGAEDDPLCLSAGVQSIHTDFTTALDLIEEVIRNWPAQASEQEAAYVSRSELRIA